MVRAEYVTSLLPIISIGNTIMNGSDAYISFARNLSQSILIASRSLTFKKYLLEMHGFLKIYMRSNFFLSYEFMIRTVY